MYFSDLVALKADCKGFILLFVSLTEMSLSGLLDRNVRRCGVIAATGAGAVFRGKERRRSRRERAS